MRILTYRATEQDAGKRVETALMGRLQVSRGLLSRLKRREDGICVNGQRVYSTYVLKAGDIVSADVGDREPPRHLEPVPMVLSIAYEDEDLLVVDKPANLPVHPTKDPAEPSLEQGLLAYLSARDYPHFVSRLDKGTTGLMLVAKSGYVHELMKRRLHTDAFCREYLAVAEGIVAPPSGVIDALAGIVGRGQLKTFCQRGHNARQHAESQHQSKEFLHGKGASLIKYYYSGSHPI